MTVGELSSEERNGIGFKVNAKTLNNTGRKKIALLVGVNESKIRGEFTKLSNPEKDIDVIDQILTQKGDFAVTKFNKNPELAEVMNWLDNKEFPEGSVFLFFFSGHGEIAPNGSTWMYMYNSDLRKNKEKTVLQESVLIDKILEKNKRLPAGKKIDIILFINACRIIVSGEKGEIDRNFQESAQKENVTRFYSSEIGGKALDNDKTYENISLFTRRFVQAVSYSDVQRNEDEKKKKAAHLQTEQKADSQNVGNSGKNNGPEKKEGFAQNETGPVHSLFSGADSNVNGGDGDYKITLIEIKKFMDKAAEVAKDVKPVVYIADGMQDFTIVDLNKSYDIFRRYVLPSAFLPGLGELNYGKDYDARLSGKVSYPLGYVYPVIFAGLAAKAAADFKVYSNRQNAFRNQSILPAQPFGQDTFMYNFFIMNDKKSELKQATARYNESAGILLGFWLFNIAQSALVPYLNNANVFSFQMDIRPLYSDQRLYANSGHWERHTSIGWKIEF